MWKKIKPLKDEFYQLMSVALKSTEDVWDALFKEQGKHYEPPKLILFRKETKVSPTIRYSESSGPQYGEGKIYFPEKSIESLMCHIPPLLKKDAAMVKFSFMFSAVLAHEVGHHIQSLTERIPIQQEMQANELDIQADYLAGVWAHHAKKQGHIEVEKTDITSTLALFHFVGADNIEKIISQPDLAHGTSEERVQAFLQGYKRGSFTL